MGSPSHTVDQTFRIDYIVYGSQQFLEWLIQPFAVGLNVIHNQRSQVVLHDIHDADSPSGVFGSHPGRAIAGGVTEG